MRGRLLEERQFLVDVVCDELHDCAWNVGMYQLFYYFINMCMFIVLKALLISNTTVIVRAGVTIWLNPFATVLFNVCSAVTVECFVPVFGMFVVMYGRRRFSSVFAITERRDMGLYEVPFSVSLLGFGIGTM